MNRRQPLNTYSMLSVGCICWMLAFMSSRLEHVIFFLLAIGGIGSAILAALTLWGASSKKSGTVMEAGQKGKLDQFVFRTRPQEMDEV